MPNANDHHGSVGKLALPAFLLFVVALTLVVTRLSPQLELSETGRPEAALLITVVLASVAAASRTLPFQNILWAALVIAVLGGLAHAVGVLAGIPFGNFVFTEAAGPRIAGTLPWGIPLLWIMVIYSSRGMARAVLSRYRHTPFYGFWMMGITVALAVILDLGLDPFASKARHFWIWSPTRLPITWHGTPLTNLLGWTITALVIVIFVTPMLINKKPGPAKAEHFSAWIWILLNILFAASGWVNGQWTLVAIVGILTAAAMGIAGRAGLLP